MDEVQQPIRSWNANAARQWKKEGSCLYIYIYIYIYKINNIIYIYIYIINNII